MKKTPSPSSAAEPWVNVSGSRFFMDWMAQMQVSLGFTTYQTGKLFLVGRKTDDSMAVFERTYGHCMGMWASPDAATIWLSSRYQIWKLQRAPAEIVPYRAPESAAPDPDNPDQAVPQWSGRGYDVAYIPRVGYTTGHVDVHDIAIDADGRLLFVNTMFGCIATFSDHANFQPLWQPPFLSRLVPEDRCHLNGLAMRDGRAAFVSVVAQSDVADGWRDRRRDGGAVLEIASGEAVATGLSMPHSPRWYRGKLWVLNSGTGELGTVDLENGAFTPVCFCPGYMRGLVFVGDYAVLTLSKPRHQSFHGLPLDEQLGQRSSEAQCGLQIIDLKTGTIAHWLRVEGTLVTELYDSIVLPGVRQPMAVGFKTNEIERLMLVDEFGTL